MNSISNNLMALDVSGTLNRHYGRLSTSVERLSSGLRINSAADDAAGLAIRELMRADVATLNQGMRNANDAISLIQVADGALGIIDEKLIRMKELAEQAATGTYDSTQRLMIHSEFQEMGKEIDRIAKATDFNGIKLLDGSLSGKHNGTDINASGKLKIHFGTANDSAEDYYYIEIGDCTTAGLGLRESMGISQEMPGNAQGKLNPSGSYVFNELNANSADSIGVPGTLMDMADVLAQEGHWYMSGGGYQNSFIFRIPAGSKNVIINMAGCMQSSTSVGDNDIHIFTTSGQHLVGTSRDDIVFTSQGGLNASIDRQQQLLGFDHTQYDDSSLNSGPAVYDGTTLAYSTYNGMTFGYTGDSERKDSSPNDGFTNDNDDFEILTIDEATEDLIVWINGLYPAMFKYYQDVPPEVFGMSVSQTEGALLGIETQEKAQKALTRLDEAITIKDKARANLGALQNRLENTVSNLSIQRVNLETSESRISDADVATEMTEFIRNQVLSQSAVAMLGQANSYPHMLASLIDS